MFQSIRRAAALVTVLIATLCAPLVGHAAQPAKHLRCSWCHPGGATEATAVFARCNSCHAAESSGTGGTWTRLSGGSSSSHSDCGVCHAPQGSGRASQLKSAAKVLGPSGVAVLDDASRLWLSCHGDVVQTRAAGGHFVRHPVGLSLWSWRHAAATSFGLPLVDVAGTPETTDDVLSCITCHDVHTGFGTASLRWSAGSESEVCRGCHAVHDAPDSIVARGWR